MVINIIVFQTSYNAMHIAMQWLRKIRGQILHMMLKVWGQQQNRGGWNVDVLWLDECQSTVLQLHLHTIPNQIIPKDQIYASLLCDWTSVPLLCWRTTWQNNLDVLEERGNTLYKYRYTSHLGNTIHWGGLESTSSSQVPALPADIPAPMYTLQCHHTIPYHTRWQIALRVWSSIVNGLVWHFVGCCGMAR